MSEQTNPQPWQRHDFYAMGCQMSAWLELEDVTTAVQALQQVEALFAAAEQRMTRFAATSELSQLNSHPNEWRMVSNVLWTVVSRALALAEQTGGRFDPTLLAAMTAAGYDRSFALLPHNGSGHSTQRNGTNPSDARSMHGQWQRVEVDAERHAIRLPTGVQLDLGGIGKGYTAQQAVNFLSQWGPCLVDAGGDLVAGDAPSTLPGWPVAVAAPMVEGREEVADLAQLWLKNAALATSGTDYRRWQQEGQPMHHLIDPQTGRPAMSDLLTVSVLAVDATVAEAWAKALLLAGLAGARQEMVEKGIAAALVDQTQMLTLSPVLAPFVGARFDEVA
ncbi:MAG: FAD:protein FMN transferase [Caldilineaceae bacterium]|nr:FAD:protein FMN transferase [Caldilineaceae bacterium]